MKLCDTCIYRNEDEYHKPCIVYRDNCEYYEKERGDMTREEAITKYIVPAIKRTWNDKRCKEILDALEQEITTGHWKRISIDKYSEHAKYWYRCDRCGNDNLGNTDWCPNCGAKMVEPQESEE